MGYVELEQFLDRGSIRAWWGLSWRTFFGCAGGAILGQQLGSVVFGTSITGVAVCTLLGAVVGLTLLLKRRGIILVRRLVVLGAFAMRAARGRAVLDGTLLGGRVDDALPQPMQIRVHEAVPSPAAIDRPDEATTTDAAIMRNVVEGIGADAPAGREEPEP